MSPPPKLDRNQQEAPKRRELRAADEEEAYLLDASSSDEDTKPGAVRVFTGQTEPSILGEPQGPSASRNPLLVVAELAGPSQEEDQLRRQNEELERIIGAALTATVIVGDGGGDKDVQDAASSPFGRKGRRLLVGAAFVLLLVVGVILGVTIPLTTNNNNTAQ
jgi:hypothetical protein